MWSRVAAAAVPLSDPRSGQCYPGLRSTAWSRHWKCQYSLHHPCGPGTVCRVHTYTHVFWVRKDRKNSKQIHTGHQGAGAVALRHRYLNVRGIEDTSWASTLLLILHNIKCSSTPTLNQKGYRSQLRGHLLKKVNTIGNRWFGKTDTLKHTRDAYLFVCTNLLRRMKLPILSISKTKSFTEQVHSYLTSVWLCKSQTAMFPSLQQEKQTLESGLMARA